MRRLRFNDTPIGDPEHGLVDVKLMGADLVGVKSQVMAPGGAAPHRVPAHALSWKETVVADVWAQFPTEAERMRYAGVLLAGIGKKPGKLVATMQKGDGVGWSGMRLIHIECVETRLAWGLWRLVFTRILGEE